jgi:hypothetical protein
MESDPVDQEYLEGLRRQEFNMFLTEFHLRVYREKLEEPDVGTATRHLYTRRANALEIHQRELQLERLLTGNADNGSKPKACLPAVPSQNET